MKSSFANISKFLDENKSDVYAAALLSFLTFAGFMASIHVVPAVSDELLLLTSVSRTTNPFSYFVGDWGMGSHFYRPLLSVSYWVVYKLFGVSMLPNQLLSILSHTLVILLLYKIIRLSLSDIPVAFLLTALSMFSINVLFSVLFTPDRCSVFVGIFFLLLWHHILVRQKIDKSLNAPYVLLLCALALMSKESGVVVVALAFMANLRRPFPYVRSWPVAIGLAGLTVGYMGIRWYSFGPNVADYPVENYLLGIYPKMDPDHFQGLRKFIPLADNTVKNVIGVLFPIYSSGGLIDIERRLPHLILFFVLYVMVLHFRQLSRVQVLAVFVIGTNAIVHWAGFRYRTLYLSQLALVIFMSASPRLLNMTLVRRWALQILLVMILGLQLFWVGGQVGDRISGNLKIIYEDHLEAVRPYVETGLIDPDIIHRVFERNNIKSGY